MAARPVARRQHHGRDPRPWCSACRSASSPAYLGGWIDELLMMRLLDSVMALPPLVLALTISAVLGPGLFNAMIAIAIVSVPTLHPTWSGARCCP